MSKVKVIRNLVGEEICMLLATELRVAKAISDMTEKLGDNPLPKTHTVPYPIGVESLLLLLNQRVNEEWGKNLLPAYAMGRILYTGSELKPHRDRRSSEYAMTLCLEKDCNYPIYFDGEEFELEPGDAVLYKGSEVMHWREKYEGKEHLQCFLFYVDAEGEFKELKYDTRPFVGLSEEHKDMEKVAKYCDATARRMNK